MRSGVLGAHMHGMELMKGVLVVYEWIAWCFCTYIEDSDYSGRKQRYQFLCRIVSLPLYDQ
jgi:hypothetical protein